MTPEELENLDSEQIRSLLNSMGDLSEVNEEQTGIMGRLGNVTLGSITGLSNFTSSALEGTESLKAVSTAVRSFSSTLGSNIPYIGGLLTGFGAATAMAIDVIDDTVSSYQDLAHVGVVGANGVTELADAAVEAAMPLKTYSKMLEKNSKDLSYLFGTALDGSKKFQKLVGTMSDETNLALRKMGYETSEFGDVMIDYNKLQTRLGFNQEMSVSRLQTESVRYAEGLMELSAITGESIEATKNARDEAMRDTRFRASLAKYSKDEQEKIMAGYQILVGKYGKQAGDEYMASVAGLITDKKAEQAVISGTRQSIIEFRDAILSGADTNDSVNEMLHNYQDASKEWVDTMRSTAVAAPEMIDKLGGGYTEKMDIANLQLKDSLTETVEEIKKRKKTEDEALKTTVAYQKAMAQITPVFQKLIISMLPAEKVINGFAKTIEKTGAEIKDWITDGGIEKTIDGLKSFVDTFITIMTPVGVAFDLLAMSLKGWGMLVEESFKFFEFIGTATASFVDNLLGNPDWKMIGEFLLNNLKKFGNIVPEIQASATAALSKLFRGFDNLMGVLSDIGKTAMESLDEVFDYIKTGFMDVFEGVMNFFKNPVDTVTSAVGGAWDSLWGNDAEPKTYEKTIENERQPLIIGQATSTTNRVQPVVPKNVKQPTAVVPESKSKEVIEKHDREKRDEATRLQEQSQKELSMSIKQLIEEVAKLGVAGLDANRINREQLLTLKDNLSAIEKQTMIQSS